MPEHPRSGPDRKAVGIVKLKIKVNDRGKVEEVEVVFNSTNSKACEQKAIEAVRQSRYQPARVQLRSVAAWTVVEYGFNSTTSH
jgi:TonB family protein